MSTTSITSVIATMREVSEQAGARNGAQSAAAGASFGQALAQAISSTSMAQQSANRMASDFQLGREGVSISDVMIESQKASIAFQTVTQVRNRVISAYQQISSMPM